MSLTLKFDQRRENETRQDESLKKSDSEKEIEYYGSSANTRNINFIQADGQEFFLNYSDLLDCEFSAKDNSITMIFRTRTIALKGQGLKKIFQCLFEYRIKSLTCLENRYIETKRDDEIFVTAISILPR